MERHPATVWESVADVVGDDIALVQGSVRRSWTAFDDRAARLATAFASAGLTQGSKVAQYLYNSPEYLEGYYATLKMRAVPVNVNYRYLDDELLYLLENADAEALIYHSSLGDRVERVRDRAPKVRLWIAVDDGGVPAEGSVAYDALVAAHEPAARIERSGHDIAMTYTGGTTGMPKGVMGQVGGGVDAIMAGAPPMVGEQAVTNPDDVAALARRFSTEGRQLVAIPACPLMHATGLGIGATPSLTFGGRIVLAESRGLDVDELWTLAERERMVSLTIVGDAFGRPLLRGLDEGPARDLDSVRVVCSAGAMFSTEVKQGLLAHLPNAIVVDFIAATEGSMGIAIETRGHPGVTGHFHPNAGVKVFTEDGVEVAPGSGESGMIAVPGAIPVGYYKDEAKTERTFREIDGVRYSIPGDWATVGDDGSLTLLGRGSQCINTGGEKVYPEEVEEAIKRHPAVEDSLVFGVADERFGQRVVGVASLAGDPVDGRAIVDTLRDQLSSFKLPRTLLIVAEVPRAPNGKADYPSARALFEAEQPG